MLDPWLAAGIAGAACILWGFLMIQTHRWTEDDFIYDLANFVGSALLVAYGVAGRAWPFVVLNGVWAVYSLRDLPGDLARRTTTARRAG